MSGFREVPEYDDKYINGIYNNVLFLDGFHDNIISPEIILYSEYWWVTLFISEHNKKYGRDCGWEQFQFKLIERIEYTLGSVDIELLEKIEKDIRNMTD